MSKTEVFKTGNRILVIKNNSRLPKDAVRRISDQIKLLFETEKIYKTFNKFTVFLMEEIYKGDKDTILSDGYPIRSGKKETWLNGHANSQNVKIDLKFVYLLIGQIDEVAWRNIIPELRDTLYHETVHYIHYRSSGALAFIKKRTGQIKKEYGDLLRPRDFDLNFIRNMATGILHKIWIEGLARFYEYSYSQRIEMTKKGFDELHNKANFLCIQLNETFMKNIHDSKGELDIEKFFEFEMLHSYDIGIHIVHAIFFYNPEIGDEILKYDIYKVMKLYEKSMINNGHTPVISLYSGIGVLDYKRVLKEIERMKKNKFLKL